MSGASRDRSLARAVGVVVGATAVLEGVFAAFLLLLASLTAASTGGALVLGAVVALVALAAVVSLWLGQRSGRLPPGALWTCRLLPVVGAVVAGALAVLGALPWLAVPLGFFAAAPASVLAMVVPQVVVPAPTTRVGGPPTPAG